MGQHGGAQELIVAVVVASTLLLAIGVYLRNHGHMGSSTVAGLWTALSIAPLVFGFARFLGYA
jgi:hypothetical protein